MNEQSRIRFNPVTKEIEIEGSEAFVKTYFDRLQAMMSGFTKEQGKGSEIRPPQQIKTQAIKKHQPQGKVFKPQSRLKQATQIGSIIEIIQEYPAGIATSALKEKTGLTELQIWNIINRAVKAGKIRKIKRGLYGAV